MSKRKLTAGITSVMLPIFVQDTTSTTGGGLSGLTFSTGSLVAEYRRQGQSAWTAITLAAGTLGTYVNSGAAGTGGGFIADGASAGDYELCIPNACFVAGARWVVIRLRGAANMLTCRIEIEIDTVDYQDATHFGLTALPNVAAGAVGGVPLSFDTSGRMDVIQTGADKVWATASRTLSAAGVQAIWDALTSALTTAGSIGKRILDFFAGINYTAPPAALTDYQQRGVAVTLPTLPNVTVGGYATGQDPATLLLAAVVDGTITFKEKQELDLATIEGRFTVVRDTVAKTLTVTYFHQPPNQTVVMAVLVTTYSDTALTLAVSRAVTFSNLP